MKKQLTFKPGSNSVGRFINVFFLPIFFTYTGLRTHIGGLDTWHSGPGVCSFFFSRHLENSVPPI